MTIMWKAVPTWEQFYEVSDAGVVRSLDRVVYTERGPQHWRSRVLSAKISSKTGYVRVNRGVVELCICGTVHPPVSVIVTKE